MGTSITQQNPILISKNYLAVEVNQKVCSVYQTEIMYIQFLYDGAMCLLQESKIQ